MTEAGRFVRFNQAYQEAIDRGYLPNCTQQGLSKFFDSLPDIYLPVMYSAYLQMLRNAAAESQAAFEERCLSANLCDDLMALEHALQHAGVPGDANRQGPCHGPESRANAAHLEVLTKEIKAVQEALEKEELTGQQLQQHHDQVVAEFLAREAALQKLQQQLQPLTAQLTEAMEAPQA